MVSALADQVIVNIKSTRQVSAADEATPAPPSILAQNRERTEPFFRNILTIAVV